MSNPDTNWPKLQVIPSTPRHVISASTPCDAIPASTPCAFCDVAPASHMRGSTSRHPLRHAGPAHGGPARDHGLRREEGRGLVRRGLVQPLPQALVFLAGFPTLGSRPTPGRKTPPLHYFELKTVPWMLPAAVPLYRGCCLSQCLLPTLKNILKLYPGCCLLQ